MATNKQIEDAWNNAHKVRGKNPEVQWEENRSKSDKYPYLGN